MARNLVGIDYINIAWGKHSNINILEYKTNRKDENFTEKCRKNLNININLRRHIYLLLVHISEIDICTIIDKDDGESIYILERPLSYYKKMGLKEKPKVYEIGYE